MQKEEFIYPNSEGQDSTLWIATSRPTDYPSLIGDLSVDVAVVGGGIVGLTAAMLLKVSGAKVALMESGRIGYGVSGHTTAKITSAHGIIYRYLIDRFSQETARRYAEANGAAIDFIASYVKEYAVDCDFRRTFACSYVVDEHNLKQVQDEVEAAGKLGLPVSYSESLPLPFTAKGAIRYDNQALFHPRKYLLALAERIPGKGSYLFERTRVKDVQEQKRHFNVVAAMGTIRAEQVIIATHFPILNRGMLFAKMIPIRSYLMAVKVRGDIPEGMYYRAEAPVHTFRKHAPANGEAVLLIGGENHEVGHEPNTVARYRRIESFARSHFDVESVLYRWSTQDNHPVDRIPFIGRHSAFSRNLYVATGFQGWGMTNGTAAAMILSDRIAGRPNEWSQVFDPGRSTPYLAKAFFTRNLHVAKTYVMDRVSWGQKKHVSDLARGEAALLKREGKEMAVYKDAGGGIHASSSKCAHMGCKVSWNNAEKSWDCPCHGSRFDLEGKVIHAPATEDLKKIQHPRGPRVL